ncbi:MAG: glycosyltransferase, partial [Atopobium sp.]|nr:glycosyltransferase [Atopobium sp.]
MHERSYNPHMISVLMAADNDADAIRTVIRQLQEQTYPHWELIIVDNSSDPQIARMLDNLANQEPRLDVLCQSGISHFVALEIAQGRARGAYTLTTEPSYRFNPHVLQKLYTAATALGPIGSPKAADIVIAHMKTANAPMECKRAFGAKASALSQVFEESQLPYLTSMSGK